MIDDLALAALIVAAVVVGACIATLMIERWMWRE